MMVAASTAAAGCTRAGGTGGGSAASCAEPSDNAGEPYCLASSQRVRVAGAGSLASGSALIFNVDDDTAVIVARDDDGFFARSAICTHACCIVSVCGDADCIDPGNSTPDVCTPSPRNNGGSVLCPCHGSIFRLSDGAPLNGPATRPLPAYELEVDGSDIIVDTGSTVGADARKKV
jgi:Rieske Fe-S protein